MPASRAALFAGRYAARVESGLPPSRATYFLDPWNSPYWIRIRCDALDRPSGAFVYSFGPNRRRESGEGGPAGDDVGLFLAGAR